MLIQNINENDTYLVGCLVMTFFAENSRLISFSFSTLCSAPLNSKLRWCIKIIFGLIGCWRIGGWGAGDFLLSDINKWVPFFDGVFKGWWLWCLTALFFPLIIFSFAQLVLVFVNVSLQHAEEEGEADDELDRTNCVALLFLFALSW